MPTYDTHGNLATTTWGEAGQLGFARSKGTVIELSCVNRDAEGFKTPYRHVRVHMKGPNGDLEYLLTGPEAKQFADEMAIYAREAQRVVDAPTKPTPDMGEPKPLDTRPAAANEAAVLRAELATAQQRIAELSQPKPRRNGKAA